MNHQLVRTLRCGILSAFCVILVGCGGSQPAPKPVVTQQPPPQPVAPISPPSTPASSPATPQPSSTKAVAAETSKSRKPKNASRLRDEDPRNVFEISDTRPRSEQFTVSDVAEVNQFELGDLPGGMNSRYFTVEGAASTGTALSPNVSGAIRPTGTNSFKLPEGFVAVQGSGISPEGLPWRITCTKSGGTLALVPGGICKVGSTDGPPETQPEFTPFLETFYLHVTEVTLGEYQKFRDDLKGDKKSRNIVAPLNEGQNEKLPALGIPWGVAQAYAHWAGEELPTEAEFEKATRGLEGYRAPWGNGRAVWSPPRTPETLTLVASYVTDQSPYGIYDLAGNAREWCSDWYSDTAHQQATEASERQLQNWDGPRKASVSGQRVVKGNGPDWSAWHREGRAMSERSLEIGFRCVLRIRPESSAK